METKIPKLRTLSKVVTEIKEIDPKSDLTVSDLKNAIADGQLPKVNSGKKIMVNIDNVLEYMRGRTYTEEELIIEKFKQKSIKAC